MIGIKRGKSIRPILFAVRRRYVGVGRKYLLLYRTIIYFHTNIKN